MTLVRCAVIILFPVILSLMNCLSASADKRKSQEDTSTFVIRPFLMYSTLSLNINDVIFYEPNTMLNIGMAVSWKGFGGSYSTAAMPVKDTNRYGETDYSDVQLYYYFDHFNIDLIYQNYRGFCRLESTGGECREVRSDMEMLNAGINLTYVFSDNYSFKASFSQTERQPESAGSFLLMSAFSFFKIFDNRSLIPVDQEFMFRNQSGFHAGYYPGVSILGGYSYSHIFREQWYATISVLLGGGWMHQKIDTDAGRTSVNSACSRFNNRLAVGYNGESWYAGVAAVIDLLSNRPLMTLKIHRTSDILRLSVYGTLFYGVRF